MIDGLRRDFPRVFALARRIPSPRFAHASPIWGVVAAFGAGFFVSAALVVVLTMTSRLLGAPMQWVGGVTTAGATATAITVAFTVGGRGALIVYAGVIVIERLLGLPGLMRFCLAIVSEFAGCSPVSYVLALWPEALAVALAYWLILVRWMGTTEGDGNPLLEAAGALALTQGAAAAILGALLLSTSGSEAGLLLLLSAVAGGIACGLVMLRRIAESRQWRSLAIIALAVMAVWLLVSVPALAGQVGIGGVIAVGGLNLIGFISPLVEIGAAALVLYMVAARKVAATETA
jgi:hypothetical protein